MPTKRPAKATVLIAVILDLPAGPRVHWTADVEAADDAALERAVARAIYAAAKHGCPVNINVTPLTGGVGSAPTVTVQTIAA